MDNTIPPTPPAVINYADPREFKADMLRKFLAKISQLESSGGRNLAHKEMQEGMHKGTAATGQYGLMPATAQDIARGSGLTDLDNLAPDEVQASLEADPALNKRLAETLASKLLNKNTEEEAAYKWLNGQYSNPSPETLAKSDRVQKFRVLKNE